MGFETMDDFEFECELINALAWRPAPPDLKRRVLDCRQTQRARRRRMRTMWWQRLAPLIVIAGLAAGAMLWRHATETRSGEGAKQQVFTVLHTVNHALRQIDGHLWRLTESAK